MTATNGPGPRRGSLEGVRVLSVEAYAAGPWATMMLADAGAEVVKVEALDGEPGRRIGPFAGSTASDPGLRASAFFARFNRRKKSVVLDLQHPEGADVFRRLAAVSDVVLTNLRAGALERLGLGYRDLSPLNSRLIYVSVTGFGAVDGGSPFRDRPAFDMLVQGLGGLMHLVGSPDGPPTWLGVAVGDLYPGTLAAYGTMAALYERERTGAGQLVDVAMYDGMVSLNERAIAHLSATGQVLGRGEGHELFAPYGPFAARDGYIVIAAGSERAWQRLCGLLGRDDLLADPRLADGQQRAAHVDTVLRPAIEEWLRPRTRAEAVELLARDGIPAGPVQTAADVLACPHVEARGMVMAVRDNGAVFRTAGNPVRLSAHPHPATEEATPALGQHTDQVLTAWLGLDGAALGALRAKRVIG